MNDSDKPQDNNKDEKKLNLQDVAPIQTQHEIQLGRKKLKYTVHAGMMPLKDDLENIEAEIFFTSYTLDGTKNPAERPLIFVFNGGPGSSSVWLHLGALGPKRVKMQDEGWMPAPPYQLVDNDQTWLDLADLVFIDPVGTGYSRAAKKDDNKKYWGLEGDLKAVGEFIRLYLTRYARWTSPLFLAGESYGTTRAAGLSDHLLGLGIAVNGIMLISTVLNFQTILFTQLNDMPYQLFVPTYTATAWYHKALTAKLQARELRDLLQEVEAWVEDTYVPALNKGDQLDEKSRKSIAAKLAQYTGLTAAYVEESNLRIHPSRFRKELLRSQKVHVGRLDSRYTAPGEVSISEFPEFDPSMTAIDPPYTALMNNYVRNVLGYQTDRKYEVLSYEVNKNWEYDRGSFPDTSKALRSAFGKNPFMKIFVALGYYDMATPYYGALYTVRHMNLTPEMRANIVTGDYEAGHMMYVDVNSLKKLKDDVAAFINDAVPQS